MMIYRPQMPKHNTVQRDDLSAANAQAQTAYTDTSVHQHGTT
jgi:hypothetical protein